MNVEIIDMESLTKMEPRNDIKITTYECDEDWFIDVIEILSKDYYEAYLYHRDYAIKELIFGASGEVTDEVLEDILINADINGYVERYF